MDWRNIIQMDIFKLTHVLRSGMMSILDTQLCAALLNMIDAAEKSVHLLEHYVTGFRHDEDHKQSKEHVDATEKVEGEAA
jgi:hypothetical protein